MQWLGALMQADKEAAELGRGEGTWRKDVVSCSAGQTEARALVLWSLASPSLLIHRAHQQPEVGARTSAETPRGNARGTGQGCFLSLHEKTPSGWGPW